jgi:hypothetical protein
MTTKYFCVNDGGCYQPQFGIGASPKEAFDDLNVDGDTNPEECDWYQAEPIKVEVKYEVVTKPVISSGTPLPAKKPTNTPSKK